MSISVTPQPGGFGAVVTGVDLEAGITAAQAQTLREIWLAHQVLSFPDQPMSHPALERFARAFGDFGNDPYVASMDAHEHIIEVRREPTEAAAPFGGSWHSDWSFLTNPPSATILHAKIVPPMGGDTYFADGFAAFESLDPDTRTRLCGLTGVHSARRPYSHEGFRKSGGLSRSMKIQPSEDAWATQDHPIVRTHPESGRRALWINPVYTLNIKELSEDESDSLLAALFKHSLSDRFIYRHRWQTNTLTMWDNRSVMHCAQGGYDGHRRVMHRVTVAGDPPR